MATPSLRAIAEHFGDAEVVCVGRSASLAVLAGWDIVDDAIVDTPGPTGAAAIIGALRRRRCDLGVLFPNSFRTAALAKLGGVKHLTGYVRDCRGWLLSAGLEVSRDERGRRVPLPMLDYYAALAVAVGADKPGWDMSLPVMQDAEQRAGELLAVGDCGRHGPRVMLNPGGSFGPSKLWPAKKYAALADMIMERHDARIVINAAPGEQALAAAVASAMAGPCELNLADHDNSLPLLKSIIKRCDLLVTNDTGARHIAAALGTAVVTIFGSTDPTWALIDYPRERTVQSAFECGPCQKKRCPLPPGPKHHQCMTAIEPAHVLAAAEELLADCPASRSEQ